MNSSRIISILGSTVVALCLSGIGQSVWAQGCQDLGGYPWKTGGCLLSDDLNNAIAGRNPLLNVIPKANLFINGFDNGMPLTAQVSFNNLTGTIVPTQIPRPTVSSLGGVLSYVAPGGQFLYGITTAGQPVARKPTFSDIEGSISPGQMTLPPPTATELGGILSYTAPTGQFIYGVDSKGAPLSRSVSPPETSKNGVPSNATLKTIVGARGDRIYRLGFLNPGDGGSASYDWSTTNCTAPDNGAQVQPNGVTGCWIADFSGTQPTPMVWGAKGDGATDDAAAVRAALTARAKATLWQGPYSYYIGSGITIPVGTTFQGPTNKIAMVGISNTDDIPYASYPALRLSSTATITMLSSGTLDGVLLYRSGMVFPVADPLATFAGTAITVAGDNITLRNSLIMGFAQAFWSNGFHRGTIEDMAFDNQANIHIDNSADTWQISHVHSWPFAVDAASMTLAQINRTGNNFYLGNVNEHTMISHMFAFGYKRGYVFENVQAATCIDCDADGVATMGDGDHHGFDIFGSTYGDVTLIGPRAYAQNIGISRDDNPSDVTSHTVKISGATLMANNNGLYLGPNNTGTTIVTGSELSYNVNQIVVANANAILDLHGNNINGGTGAYSVNALVQTDNVWIGNDNRFGKPGETTIPVASPTIAAKAIPLVGTDFTPPPYGSTFSIPGGGTIATIHGEWAGRNVTLVFGGVTTVQHATTGGPAGRNQVQLSGNADFVSYGGASLSLTYLGNNAWIETARSTKGSVGFTSNNANLKLVSGAEYPNGINRQGFTTPGDGGAATYYWSGVNCVNADDGAQVQPTVTGCWIADFSVIKANVKQWGAKGDCVADDGPAFNKAIKAGGKLSIPDGHYLISTTINVNGLVILEGSGWAEDGLLAGQHCTLSHKGSYLVQTNSAISMFSLYGLPARGSIFDNFAVNQLHPMPAVGWTPTIYPPVWALNNSLGAVDFTRLGLGGVYSAIDGTLVTARILMDKIYGQVFNYLFRSEYAYDLQRASNIEMWGFWSTDNNVFNWQHENSDVFYFRRQDGFQGDNIFALGTRSCIRIGQSPSITNYPGGTGTAIQISNLFCDVSKRSIWIDSTSNGATVSVSRLWHGGEELSGTPIVGGSPVLIDGTNAFIKIDDLNIIAAEKSVITQTNTTSGSIVNLGVIQAGSFPDHGWNYGGGVAYAGTFPVIQDVSPDAAHSTYSITHPIFPQNASANAGGGLNAGIINTSSKAQVFMGANKQNWAKQVVANGVSYAWPNWADTYILNGTVASATVTLPIYMMDGDLITMTCNGAITALTVTAGAGSGYTLVNAPTSCTAGQTYKFKATGGETPTILTMK